MSKNELMYSAHLSLRDLVAAMTPKTREFLSEILVESLEKRTSLPNKAVICLRETGKDGEIVANGFLHFDQSSGQERISEAGRLRINLRPNQVAKGQQAATNLKNALVAAKQVTASQLEAEQAQADNQPTDPGYDTAWSDSSTPAGDEFPTVFDAPESIPF